MKSNLMSEVAPGERRPLHVGDDQIDLGVSEDCERVACRRSGDDFVSVALEQTRD